MHSMRSSPTGVCGGSQRAGGFQFWLIGPKLLEGLGAALGASGAFLSSKRSEPFVLWAVGGDVWVMLASLAAVHWASRAGALGFTGVAAPSVRKPAVACCAQC